MRVGTLPILTLAALSSGCFAELSGAGYGNLGGRDVGLPSWGAGISLGVFLDFHRKVRVAVGPGADFNLIDGDGAHDEGVLGAGKVQARVDVTAADAGWNGNLKWRLTAMWLGLPVAGYSEPEADDYAEATSIRGTGFYGGITLDAWDGQKAGGFLVSAGGNAIYTESDQWGEVLSIGPALRITLTWIPFETARHLFASYEPGKICGQTQVRRVDGRGNPYYETVPTRGPDCTVDGSFRGGARTPAD